MRSKPPFKSVSRRDIKAGLDEFVQAGVLIQTVKDGKTAWQNNPDFDKKYPQEQEVVFDRIVRQSESHSLGKKRCPACHRYFKNKHAVAVHDGWAHSFRNLSWPIVASDPVVIDRNDPLAVLVRDIKALTPLKPPKKKTK